MRVPITSPEGWFAVIALVAGLFLAIVMPPGAAPDETRHLSRVYLMSEGSFGVPGTKAFRSRIPKSIPDLYRAIEGEDFRQPPRHTTAEMLGLLDQPLAPGRRVGIANAGTYPPIVYLPHLIGVAPGRWLEPLARRLDLSGTHHEPAGVGCARSAGDSRSLPRANGRWFCSR